MKNMIIALLLIICMGFGVDLTDSAENFDSFMRTRGDLSGEEVVYYWSGSIYSFVPGERSTHLFEADGFNIGRLQEHDNGYMLLTREVFVYRDPETGEILNNWYNPFTEDSVDIVHVWNNPVNSYMPREDGDWQFSMPYTILPNGNVSWNLDILLAYPSALPIDTFPEFSCSNLYQGAELFHFFVEEEDLENESLTSVPCNMSWTRFGQWLPWMRMGSRPGYIVYHCAGSKLPGGFDALPEDLKNLVMEEHPEFAEAPDEWVSPNETSWSYFRKLLDNGEIQ